MKDLTRRDLLAGTGAMAAAVAMGQTTAEDQVKSILSQVKDPAIKAGLDAAVHKNLLPAAVETQYPGFFTICADGGGFGSDTTWPGLDSWQMAGAYLLLGKTRLVEDYFAFVKASQAADGNIPFAIFPGETRPNNNYLRGMKFPEDRFHYVPPTRNGTPKSSQEGRDWMRLFLHWETKSKPLAILGSVCYILTAAELYDANRSQAWLKANIESLQHAGHYIASLVAVNGLVQASGFYVELPPREGFDGVSQCYAIHAFRELDRLVRAARVPSSMNWRDLADAITTAFSRQFWIDDHFAEYIHVQRGVVDRHGLSDTNLAAVAFGVASDRQLRKLWPRLMAEDGFWYGGMPTGTMTKPFSTEEWENDPVPFDIPSLTNDVAAMGRVWYLEALACKRMRAWDRLRSSTKAVCQAAKDGYWRERYHPMRDGSVATGGVEKYCEYPAIVIRVVLGNKDVFCR